MNSAPAESLKSKIKQKCVKLIENSTFHGFPRIISSESVIRKIFWSLITAAMIVYFASISVNSVIGYLSFSVVTNINKVYEKQPTFPAVATKFANVESCYFDNKPCSESLAVDSVEYTHFNSGLNQSMYPIQNSTKPGYNYGLRLKLSRKSYYVNFFQIYIYDQAADINYEPFIIVYPHMKVDIAISKVLTSKLSSPYSDCKKEYVFEPKPLDLLKETSYPYVQSECHNLCQHREYMKICNKSEEFDSNFQYYFTNRDHYYYEFFYTEYNSCRDKNESLVISVIKKFRYIGANTICEKQCPLKCDTLSYSLTIMSNYNNLKEENSIKNNYIYIELDDFIEVNIYYPDFYYTSITEQLKMTFDDLISNFGGLLGLFLGGSLMSFFEIFELIISVLVLLFKRRKKKVKPLPKRVVSKKPNVSALFFITRLNKKILKP